MKYTFNFNLIGIFAICFISSFIGSFITYNATKIKCTHKWEVVTKDFIEAPIKNIGICESIKGSGVADLLKSKTSIILKCDKCGKLDKTIIIS